MKLITGIKIIHWTDVYKSRIILLSPLFSS